MAACKCRYCQERLTTAIAYKTEINKKSFYFCNEEHYENFLKDEANKKKKQEQEAQTREKFYNLFCDILSVNGITNTALWKEKTEINKVFSDEVIISYLEENKDWIKTSVGRLSGGEYGKIRYVSVILRNKLGDYKPKVVVMETKKSDVVVSTSSFELFEPTTKKQELKENFILEDVEDDLL